MVFCLQNRRIILSNNSFFLSTIILTCKLKPQKKNMILLFHGHYHWIWQPRNDNNSINQKFLSICTSYQRFTLKYHWSRPKNLHNLLYTYSCCHNALLQTMGVTCYVIASRKCQKVFHAIKLLERHHLLHCRSTNQWILKHRYVV